uniref:Uncharacterized protein n=1 Tax=Caenorhabditis japonica TaxID=281687 RepID=A0A8R1IWJ6_CAEJA
ILVCVGITATNKIPLVFIIQGFWTTIVLFWIRRILNLPAGQYYLTRLWTA